MASAWRGTRERSEAAAVEPQLRALLDTEVDYSHKSFYTPLALTERLLSQTSLANVHTYAQHFEHRSYGTPDTITRLLAKA